MDYSYEIIKGAKTAFINSAVNSNLAYRPEFVYNDTKKGRKVLSSIEKELSSCEEFFFSVAFITEGGIQPLLGILKELEKKKIPGKILTTDYHFFTQPRALERLAALKNIELRMYMTGPEGKGFHTKGYIFKEGALYKFIIGSSNMTQAAITVNAEWNTKFVSSKKAEMTANILGEFNALWESPFSKKFDEFFEEYQSEYLERQIIKKQHEQALKEKNADFEIYTLKPNKMQTAFVNNIEALVKNNQTRALLLSATGTGKTIASAFAARQLNPARVLFVVHREQIAKQAMAGYRCVFGSSKTYGLISGNSKEMEADFVFSTMQMMSKPEVHKEFKKDAFDLVILDEYEIIGPSQEAA